MSTLDRVAHHGPVPAEQSIVTTYVAMTRGRHATVATRWPSRSRTLAHAGSRCSRYRSDLGPPTREAKQSTSSTGTDRPGPSALGIAKRRSPADHEGCRCARSKAQDQPERRVHGAEFLQGERAEVIARRDESTALVCSLAVELAKHLEDKRQDA